MSPAFLTRSRSQLSRLHTHDSFSLGKRKEEHQRKRSTSLKIINPINLERSKEIGFAGCVQEVESGESFAGGCTKYIRKVESKKIYPYINIFTMIALWWVIISAWQGLHHQLKKFHTSRLIITLRIMITTNEKKSWEKAVHIPTPMELHRKHQTYPFFFYQSFTLSYTSSSAACHWWKR